MPHLGQRCRQLLHAFRHPDQGSHGVAQCRRLDQALERRDEARIDLRYRPTPTSAATNTTLRERLGIKVIFAAVDR
jgi:hypothetical protein